MNLFNPAIIEPVSPGAILFIGLVISNFNSLITSVNHRRSMQFSIDSRELCKVSFLNRQRLNNSLLPVFQSVFEGAQLNHFITLVIEYSKSVRLETALHLRQDQTPERATLKLSLLNLIIFYKVCLVNLLLIQK